MEKIIIKKKELQPLYDVACDSWKGKFRDILAKEPFNDSIGFDMEFMETMKSACSDSQLKVFTKVFAKYLPKEKSINSLTDVHKLLGYKSSKDYLVFEKPKGKKQKGMNAFATLLEIAAAYRLGKAELNWKNSSQRKYYVYKYWDGSAWRVYVHVCRDVLICPAGLHFHSEAEAMDSYTKFPQQYEDYWESIGGNV